jgi:hypothetical protein
LHSRPWAAVLADLLVDVGLFPAHAASGVIFRRLEPDSIVLLDAMLDSSPLFRIEFFEIG